ncbi:MAG: sugar transferase [Lachnospiraceae bacterium]|nr:sugar transferase [Lachnospiraceae bacterium]
MREWDKLPARMRTPEVREYYDILAGKEWELKIKRAFDVLMSSLLLVFLFIPMCVIALMIALDSPGGVFFRQLRITEYGRKFKIHKFRTMAKDAAGSSVTVAGDMRVTKIGRTLRKYRLDELPQLIDVLFGDMSFVGTRPEVPKYVKEYTPEMYATLLMKAGITSKASIQYKDEEKLLDGAEDVDAVYTGEILPAKMKYNLEALKSFSLADDLMTMIKTVLAVLG